ncbi:STAS domain-containing protein [Saprospira grandis]|uniref:Anti-anti-sigma regulatory factor n=1 Tax=Saprospira grandis (strain Lewin) TaxID=984262 RepID=H6L371_SAPGL|nr:STAS domain-containing protein [Saprospira grandis]AFC24898.1 anti-anti-sigma regulatory factor [Saprospira grandis str. Lewin]
MKEINIQHYKKKYFIKEEDLEDLRAVGSQLETEFRTTFDSFYAYVDEAIPLDLGYKNQTMGLIRQVEKELWLDIVAARYNEQFISSSYNFGHYFAQTGVPLEVHNELLFRLFEAFYQAYKRKGLNTGARVQTISRMSRTVLDIISEVHNSFMQSQLEEQNEALRELSTPVAQIAENVLLLPLVGFIDSKRAKDMMESMLSNIAEQQAKVFILDISGVAIVDTAVANHLIKMTKASRLMGCHCIISGVSGPIAQTIVELGIQIDEIDTRGSMRDALAAALNRNL